MNEIIKQVEDLLSRSRILKPPKKIILLDGVIYVPRKCAIAIGAHKKGSDSIILTPLIKEDTIPHEILHFMGWNETVASNLGKAIALKESILPSSRWRNVKYKETKLDKDKILQLINAREPSSITCQDNTKIQFSIGDIFYMTNVMTIAKRLQQMGVKLYVLEES